MAKKFDLLTDKEIKNITEPGLYHDGLGLYLSVGKRRREPGEILEPAETVETGRSRLSSGTCLTPIADEAVEAERPLSKSWVLRYQLNGKQRWMGLGGYPDVSLKKARDLRRENRELIAQGIDPLKQRKTKAAEAKEKLNEKTFEVWAAGYISAHDAGWRSSGSSRDWNRTLATYAYPVIGDLLPADVTTPDVLKILQPIWYTKTETAKRLRGRIESVLDFAKFHGARPPELLNPATWKGHLEHALPAPEKLKPEEHFACVPWHQMAAFMAELPCDPVSQGQGAWRFITRSKVSALCLKFQILTVVRPGAAIGALWSEINMDTAVWTLPSAYEEGMEGRNKTGPSVCIPLSRGAMDILRELVKLASRNDEGKPIGPVFRGRVPDQPLQRTSALRSVMAHLPTTWVDEQTREPATVHGFRASFKTWATETGQRHDLVEAALQHTQGKLNASYQRGKLLEGRRLVMEHWSIWCSDPHAYQRWENEMEAKHAALMAAGNNVVPLVRTA